MIVAGAEPFSRTSPMKRVTCLELEPARLREFLLELGAVPK
ncbi:MAG TPA: hypothetical protein VKB50_26745 [Vicinamibacterales bacterium]|nr:hypothetical protein [Vicinamibacterales bacterium]